MEIPQKSILERCGGESAASHTKWSSETPSYDTTSEETQADRFIAPSATRGFVEISKGSRGHLEVLTGSTEEGIGSNFRWRARERGS